MHGAKRLPFAFLLLGLLMGRESAASQQDVPRLGTFIYSDFCVSAQSSDLYGTRITLRRLADGDMLIYEYTNGSTPLAVVADGLVVEPKSGTVQFAVSNPDGGIAKISGQFLHGGRALTLKTPLFGDPKRTYTLTRVDNPAASVPDCK
jgi:hypothetical protein